MVYDAAAREHREWETLVDQYRRLVWSLLHKFDNLNQTERADLFQDVFVTLLDRGLQHFHGSTVSEFRMYLKTLIVHEVKGYLRRHDRHFEGLDPFFAHDEEKTLSLAASLADSAFEPENLVAGQDLQGLRRCLQDIPALDQEIFWMHERGRSYQEITKALGLAEGTVASTYHRTKTKLEECLRKAKVL